MANSGGEEDEMQQEVALETPSEESVDIFEDKLRELVESSQIDFDSWTLLIAEVENTTPNNIKRISQVYDYFLSEFPLCYGYWIRYANHKARLCNFSEVQGVYERAVQAVAYSVDLWASYCSFAVMSYEDPSDIRRLFERGLSFVGKDYFCDFLWDKYIEFEYSQKEWSCLAHIYINTLRFPTRNLQNYYERFKRLCAMWEEDLDFFNNNVMPSENVPTCEVLDAEACKRGVISNIVKLLLNENDDHPHPDMVKQYLSVGELLYQISSEIDSNINCFEARIRRHYFHVKPLDDGQLENWHKYLDFVELQGDFDWAIKLYERCLIACAHYPEFWIRYVDFANAKGGKELAGFALARASNVFLKKIPAFHVYCAIFKEQHGDISSARASFSRCGTNSSLDLIEIVNRRANMEKRMGNSEEAFIVYEKAIEMAMEKDDCYTLSVLYSDLAQFTHVVHGSIDAAREVFVKGMQQKPCRPIVEAMIRFLTVHGGPGQILFVDSVVAEAIIPDSDISRSLSSNDREDISRLFLKFVDLYGTVQEIRKAWDRHSKLFPQKMKPLGHDADTEKIVLGKIKDLRSMVSVVSPHHLTGDDNHYGPDVHMVENSFMENHSGDMPEEAVIYASQVEENRSPATGTEADADDTSEMQRKNVEEIKLGEELMLPIHQSSAGFQTPEGESENHTTASQVHGCTGTESIECTRSPAMDRLLINSPEGEEQKTRPTTFHRDGAQESSKFNGDMFQDNAVMGELSAINISRSHSSPQVMLGKDYSPLPPSNDQSQPGPQKDYSPLHQSSDKSSEEALRSPCDDFPVTQMPTSTTPSQANLEKDCSLWCFASERSSWEAQECGQLQRQPHSMSKSQHASPAKGSSPHNSSTDGKFAWMYDNRRSPTDSSGNLHGFVQSPQPPHIQIAPQLQYGPTASNSQTLTAQTYPFQFQAWTNTQQGQQANQIQGQYQMAVAQFYPMSTVAWPGTNMMPQSFVYAKPQISSQLASQPQVQVYQYPLQGNEQYEYLQSGQGFPPHIWQFCQQQLYYLQQQQQQQQQNQQLNQTQVQLQIEHWQQPQRMELQQDQQPPEQIEQQNQGQVNQKEPQNLSDQEKHDQQQHLYQYQQQNQQIDHQQQQQLQSPQQQYLQYLQQQQLYLQQQQLFWQQQQQQMLHQQQQRQIQQQQLPQQQQIIQQQQQQILQQQQMLQQQLQQQTLHQQQQQSAALDFQASHNSYYLQQALHLQQYAASQHAQYHGQQDVTQGESAQTHDTNQSAAASPSADQQAQ